jgi:hypothetical protein
MHAQLDDFESLVLGLAAHPTQLAEIKLIYLQPLVWWMLQDKAWEACGSLWTVTLLFGKNISQMTSLPTLSPALIIQEIS